jgi:hypothetical protein
MRQVSAWVTPDIFQGARRIREDSMPEHESETLDLDFLPTQPAVTAAMRKRTSKAWANAERDRDRAEIEDKESA